MKIKIFQIKVEQRFNTRVKRKSEENKSSLSQTPIVKTNWFPIFEKTIVTEDIFNMSAAE